MISVYALAEELLRTALAEVTAAPDGAPARTLVALVDEPWDECCDGVLFVRVSQVFPVSPFPIPATGPSPCPPTWAAALDVVLLRCAPTPESNGATITIPTADETTAAAARLLADSEALIAAVTGQVAVWRTRRIDAIAGAWTAVGPDGGCTGQIIPVTVEIG
jgi:hypothetical protein